MTNNFKKADETFQELMKKVNNKLVTTNGQIIRDGEGHLQIKGKNNITSPSHYVTDKGFEVFDVQEAFIQELKGMAASYWCDVVKYILRFQRKNGVEDLKKARYYLDKLISEESDND